MLQQQGRVQLDADWNEQVLLQDHLDRLVTEDTIGPHGAPEHRPGMAIAAKDGQPLKGPVPANKLWISPGRYYVHGILCENEEAVRLVDQPDLPGVGLTDQARTLHRLPGRVAQVHHLGGEAVAARGGAGRPGHGDPEQDGLAGAGPVREGPAAAPDRVRAAARPGRTASGPVTSPCDAPTGTGFRRLDNQLYRVEIRDADRDAAGEPQQATFLWSRENGSVTARLLKLNGNDLVLDSIGRDGRLSFDKGWIEVTNPGQVLRGEPGFLGSIGHVQGNTVTVTWVGDPPPDDFDVDGAIVRRWESGPLPVRLPADPEKDWIDLESGVQIQFRDTGFRTGDYWLIPARTANLEGVPAEPGLAGNVDWPQDADGPEYLRPEGIWHSYADIAGLVLGDDGWTVTDLRPVFPPITELAAEVEVGYAGGDGQQVLAGEALPQPLEVSVTRRGKGVPGATVRFQSADPGGRLADSKADLASAAAFLDAIADPDGVARCWWQPASGTPADHLRVTARYVGKDGNLTDPLIDFSAAFAQASDVGFDPAGCARLVDADTVQDAIHTLAATAILVPADGDGQDGTAGTDLPRPVAVQVHTGCGDPVLGAAIRFTVASGAVAPTQAGLAGAGTSTGPNITTDQDGLARCWWHLGDETPVQTLTATLLLAGGAPDPAAEPVTFVAGVVPADGLHVTEVLVTSSGAQLPNDAQIAVAELAGGLTVSLDGRPEPAEVIGKPVLTVTLDLPYPLSRGDLDLWGAPLLGVAGSVPLTLAGQVAMDGTQALTWVPTQSSPALLDRVFSRLTAAGAGDQVLCHLALDGRATRGAGYTQWNKLVASKADLMLVPHRRGKLQLPSAREMVAHTMPRDAVRAVVPAGVHVKDEPAQDPGTARRAAGNAFRNGADRRLVLVVAEPYAAAARALADALADAVQVRLEIIATADPAAEAGNRIAAGQPVDGILTDDASAAAVTALPDFPEAYPL